MTLAAASANAQGYVSIGGPGFSLSFSDSGRYYSGGYAPIYTPPAYVYTPPPIYYAPPPVYYAPPPVTYYNPGYRYDRRRSWNDYYGDRPRHYYSR